MGILYCKARQSSEEEMYNNEEAGPAFEEFLSLIGERVCLKAFSKYAAQLDTKSKSQCMRQGVCGQGASVPVAAERVRSLPAQRTSARVLCQHAERVR